MPVVWTPEARKQLLPRTRAQAGAPPKQPKTKPAWEKFRKALAVRGKYDPMQGTFVAGRNQATTEHAALMEKCEAIARSEEPPTIDDVGVAAAFLALSEKLANRVGLELLLGTKGVVFAYHAWLRSRDFGVTPSYVNWNQPFFLHAAAGDGGDTAYAYFASYWRGLLLPQPEAVRAECKQLARTFFERGNLGQRTIVASSFFEEQSWTKAVCKDWLARGKWSPELLYPIASDLETAKEMIEKREWSRSFAELVETFGEALLPLLVEATKAPRDDYDARYLAEALSLYDDEAAAMALGSLLARAKARPFVQSYFARFPTHAEAALGGAAGAKGRGGKIAKEVLEGARRAAAGAAAVGSEASDDELPPVLRSPPWLEAKRPKRPVTSLELVLEPFTRAAETVEWRTGERERALAARVPDKEASPETLADHARLRAEKKAVGFLAHKNERLPDELVLETWNEGLASFGLQSTDKLRFALAKFGDRAWPGVVAFVDQLERQWGDLSFLLRVSSPRLALGIAKVLDGHRHGKLAWQWLQKHSEMAAIALIPAAFRDESRDTAERALFRLVASGLDVIGLGARYGKEAKAALEKLFAWDPIYDVPKKIPKLGASWRPETLTRPVLKGSGKPLSLAALEHVATMLAFSPLAPPYAGIVQLKAACEPRSLAEFSWDAARSWEHAGHKARDRWMLTSLVHFADDEVVRRLTPGVRVDYAVEVLEVIGTDAALMELATIAGRTQSQGYEWSLAGRIEKILDKAAAVRGMTKEELEDDLAPTAMLDEDGALTLDFGPRKVRVGFDEKLEPYVLSEAGARVRAMPPARKGDDDALVARAKVIWTDVKEDVSVLAARRIRALEQAMVAGRTWSADRFRTVWLEHRLMKHLGRGVLWTDGRARFRVAEDGTLSDVEDAEYTLSPDAKIGVAHPLRSPREEVERWRTIFTDYKLVQPFPQLERRFVDVGPAATRIPWPFAPTNAHDLTTRLQTRGFRRAQVTQGKWGYQRELPTGGAVHVEYKSVKGSADDIEILFLQAGKEAPAANLDAVHLSDAVYDMQS